MKIKRVELEIQGQAIAANYLGIQRGVDDAILYLWNIDKPGSPFHGTTLCLHTATFDALAAAIERKIS